MTTATATEPCRTCHDPILRGPGGWDHLYAGAQWPPGNGQSRGLSYDHPAAPAPLPDPELLAFLAAEEPSCGAPYGPEGLTLEVNGQWRPILCTLEPGHDGTEHRDETDRDTGTVFVWSCRAG